MAAMSTQDRAVERDEFETPGLATPEYRSRRPCSFTSSQSTVDPLRPSMRQRAHPTDRISRHPSRRPGPHVVDLTGSDEPAGSDTTVPARRSPSPEVLFISSRPRPQSRPSPRPRNNDRCASRPSRRSTRTNNVQQPGATFGDLMEDLLRPAPHIPVLPCAPPGFTLSPGPDDTIVCPKCMHELCSGRTEQQRLVWVIEACGHVSVRYFASLEYQVVLLCTISR